ncbi:MAG: hypothetical protein JWM21_757 [Acidobacteria bacterium]|nr:hypothetical protein [Acidobacteriota bacterium]
MMLNSLWNLKSRTRPVLFALFLIGILSLSACSGIIGKLARKQVGVPQLLTPLVDANTSQLIAEVNRLAAVKSIHGKLDIQFQDTSFASSGIAEKYRSADANITVQRPGKVYLVIQFALVDIAQMTSDGEHFRVALLKGDEKYRRFVKGTNNATYGEIKTGQPTRKIDKGKMVPGEAVSTLSNLRPQHLTDALLVWPIPPPAESGLLYAQSEFYEEEPDSRPQAKKGARVVRSYYLLEELAPTHAGETRLKRRIWFDRVGTIRLARLQTFDERGLLDTDVSYSAEKAIGGDTTASLPTKIELTRPKDQYKVSLTYQAPESVSIDKEYTPQVFVLENKWQLPEVDLDAKKDTKPTP